MFYVEMGAEKANIKEDHPKIPQTSNVFCSTLTYGDINIPQSSETSSGEQSGYAN